MNAGEPFEERMYRSAYERHASKVRKLAESIQAETACILRYLDQDQIPVLRSLIDDALNVSNRVTAMETLAEIKAVYDSSSKS